MTIEIRELVIRATIQDKSEPSPDDGADSQSGDRLVRECVEKVLRILERKKER